ncbi:MAG: dihydrodipicolinate reductase [Desulfobacteraceae bacterium]|nr:dihydrodipicolinate reductase [Desulfobacteraceae bacterium]
MQPISLMINGLPGNVAAMLADKAAKDSRFQLIDASLTGAEITTTTHAVNDRSIALIPPKDRQGAIAEIRQAHKDFIAIDFTHPSAVNDNARFYCANQIPFVMGTTGGDRQELVATVENSDTCAVIAPNMAKQIVGFQAMMAYAAQNFPNLFAGYELTIEESHQQTKADTSGTARAMVDYFNKLGADFSQSDIIRIRDPQEQKDRLGVDEQYLSGHGWHTYTLVSPDKTVTFRFTHNVNGRDIYAQGTFDAVLFLAGKIDQGQKGGVFSMIDVLKQG